MAVVLITYVCLFENTRTHARMHTCIDTLNNTMSMPGPPAHSCSLSYLVNREADCVTGRTRRTLALRNVSFAHNTILICCCLGGSLCDCPTKGHTKQHCLSFSLSKARDVGLKLFEWNTLHLLSTNMCYWLVITDWVGGELCNILLFAIWFLFIFSGWKICILGGFWSVYLEDKAGDNKYCVRLSLFDFQALCPWYSTSKPTCSYWRY